MTVVLPAVLNEDNIPVIMSKQLGTPMSQEAQLNLLADMAPRVVDVLSVATITTSATTADAASPDITKLTTTLTKLKVAK